MSEKNGKQVPEKIGLSAVQREGLDYELTLVLEMDVKHHAVATKDRTGLYMDKPQFTPNEATGQQILKWCQSGISKEAVTDMIRTSGSMQTLREIFNTYPEFQVLLNAEYSGRRKQLEPNAKSKTPVKS